MPFASMLQSHTSLLVIIEWDLAFSVVSTDSDEFDGSALGTASEVSAVGSASSLGKTPALLMIASLSSVLLPKGFIV